MTHGRSVKIVTTRNIDKSSVDGRIISLIHMNFILKWSTCVHLCPPVDPKKAMSFDSTRKSVELQSSGSKWNLPLGHPPVAVLRTWSAGVSNQKRKIQRMGHGGHGARNSAVESVYIVILEDPLHGHWRQCQCHSTVVTFTWSQYFNILNCGTSLESMESTFLVLICHSRWTQSACLVAWRWRPSESPVGSLLHSPPAELPTKKRFTRAYPLEKWRIWSIWSIWRWIWIVTLSPIPNWAVWKTASMQSSYYM